MTKKLPKGRARRGQSVRKVMDAFKTQASLRDAPQMSFVELRKETGLSSRTLSKTLQELMDLDVIDREVSYDIPPKVYYRVVEFVSEEQLEELEKEYEQQYDSLISVLGQRLRLEHEAKHKGFEYLKTFYHTVFPRTRSTPQNQMRRREIFKKLYFKCLHDYINHLQHALRKEHESSQHKDWEKCGNCKHGKMIYGERIEEKVAIQCTLRWRQRGGREQHPSDFVCDKSRNDRIKGIGTPP